MAVKVLRGGQLDRHQRKLTFIAQQDELNKRLLSIIGHTYRDLELIPWMNYFERRGMDFNARRPGISIGDRLKKVPDASLALIDLVEGIYLLRGDQRAYHGKVVARGWWAKEFFGLRAIKVIFKFVAIDAYIVAAEIEKLIAMLRATYGRSVMSKLAIQVDVMEPPMYVSPSSQFKALSEAAND